MKTFKFTMYIKTGQGQQFRCGQKVIQADNYDIANKLFSRMDLPFHTFAVVDCICITQPY